MSLENDDFEETDNDRPIKEAIRKEYIKVRRETDSPHYHDNKMLDGVLQDAASMCKESGLTPAQFVRYQYSRIRGVFYVNMLISRLPPAVVYKGASDAVVIPMELRFGNQTGYLLSQLKLGRTVEEVLADDEVQFYAWFRIIATKKPIHAIIITYLNAALEELKEDPSILEYLQDKNYPVHRYYDGARGIL